MYPLHHIIICSPTKLLAIAIQKRRALFGRKERDYRLELLQTGFIQSLCKHLGERRARSFFENKKRIKDGVTQSLLGCARILAPESVFLVQ
ncbi:unnamed protein product [Heligmosomoides polygyrus]|uniref:Transposase n=1 Tax=Heligmosomoides polygyrus TaxID=6339 RepID=A0A183G3R5_HELPZ|nr:unnamed protein product [Heligmosomoides polygyrus]